jgi:hypothetical protein
VITALILCLLLVSGISCNKDSPSAEEVFLDKIVGTWVPATAGVELDGEDVSDIFEDFEVTFTSDRTYNTTDGNDRVWDNSGTFTLSAASNDAGFNIIRDDDVEIRVEELTEDKLILSFNYDASTGRKKSVSGEFVFDLERE